MGAKMIQGRKHSHFSKWYFDNWIATWKKMKMDLLPTQYTKTNSKWTIDFNIRAKTINLLKENIGINLCDVRLGNEFLKYDTQITSNKRK